MRKLFEGESTAIRISDQQIINDFEFPDNPKKAIYNGYMKCEAQYLRSCTNEFSGSCATMILIVGKVINQIVTYIQGTQETAECCFH